MKRLLCFAAADQRLFDPDASTGLDEPTFAAFLDAVAVLYSDANPFHNFARASRRVMARPAQATRSDAPPVCRAPDAFMVTATAWRFLAASPTLRALLAPPDVLALLAAAVCHDAGHGGVTNAFLVNSKHHLAMRYNDTSVNENSHASLGWGAVEQCRLLHAPRPVAAAVRKTFVAAVLGADSPAMFGVVRLIRSPATDMVQHRALLARVADTAGAFSRDSADDRLLLVSFLLHTADLCTALLPAAINEALVRRLCDEFSAHAAAEAKQGLPVTCPLASQGKGDPASVAASEVCFLDFVSLPCVHLLAKVAPDLGDLVGRAAANRERWSAAAALGTARPAGNSFDH